MRILILGGEGMLGHQLWKSWHASHEVWVTARMDGPAYAASDLSSPGRAISGVDVRRLGDIVDALAMSRPELVVNAVGIVKQRPSAKEYVPSIEVNSLFPHQLARASAASGARMVHLSTDCVFSGDKGTYVETDRPDPVDLYGRSKLLGEVSEASNCLTLRTSIIGLELGHRAGLVEWFLAQRGRIKGFRRAIYSGLTTAEMARAIEHLVLNEAHLSGVWHLSSAPIDKYTLLESLLSRLRPRGVEIVPDDAVVCKRDLDSTRLQARTTYRVPSWDAMLDELADSICRRERTA